MLPLRVVDGEGGQEDAVCAAGVLERFRRRVGIWRIHPRSGEEATVMLIQMELTSLRAGFAVGAPESRS